MICDFHFSHEFLSCDSLENSVVNQAILDCWLNYGCLVAPITMLSDYKEWLAFCDDKFRDQWVYAFSHNLIKGLSGKYRPVSSMGKLPECFEYMHEIDVQTLVINQTELKALNLKNGRYCEGGFEVVNINNLNESEEFKRSIQCLNKGIVVGENISDVWMERFSNLARRTKVITIIDRYFFEGIEYDIGNRSTSLENFINFLGQTGGEYSLSIFSVGLDDGSDRHMAITNYISKTLSKNINFINAISYLELNSCEDKIFQQQAHDRFIKFDDFTIQLGLGMSIFRSFPLSNCSFSFYRSFKDLIFSKAHSAMAKKRQWRFEIN